MLSGLVTSNTRIKLLVRFFANPKATCYLRGLADEFNLSTNSVREELNRLSEAKLLTSQRNGREVHYRANAKHPLFNELLSMVQKALGIDQIIQNVINRLGDLEKALLVGDYAQGRDSGIIDLILVGQVDQTSLLDLVPKTEKYIKRKIRTLVLTPEEYRGLARQFETKPHLELWRKPVESS
ncbi:MAG: winged helix-turn-helix transcriptional regulator [Deltaproteobacteria bacterium]|nr:winged helix-turn-helix transcriptional regulator [Deltaproteobacteria bacterium]